MMIRVARMLGLLYIEVIRIITACIGVDATAGVGVINRAPRAITVVTKRDPVN